MLLSGLPAAIRHERERAEAGSSVEAAVQCGSGGVQHRRPGIPQLNRKGGLGGRFRIGRTDVASTSSAPEFIRGRIGSPEGACRLFRSPLSFSGEA